MKQLLNTNFIIWFMLLAAFGMVSCDEGLNTADTADPISTDNYPTLSFSTDFEGNEVAEGDTIMYQVTTDKPFENPVSLELSVSGDNVVDHDVENTEVEFPAFSADTVEFPVIFAMDDIPEETKELTYTIEDQDIGTQYTIHPDTEFPEQTVTVENVNDPNGLTVALDWENSADDLDLYGLLYVDGSYADINVNAATADKPETLVEDTGEEGEWYYTIDPFEVEQEEVNYTLSVGYPNQEVEIFEGSFNADDPSLTEDLAGLRVMQVTSTENASGDIEFSTENLNPEDSND